MEIVRATKNNLASVLMGKNIPLPWRGQKDVLISVPFSEWLEFIHDYQEVLCNRRPLDYKRMFEANNEETYIRYFMFEISWALYNEISMSADIGRDATLILPYFDNGKSILLDDVLHEIQSTDSVLLTKFHNSLKSATRNYNNLLEDCDAQFGIVEPSKLSSYNVFAFEICLFLQSKSTKVTQTEKLNIDWR